MLWVPTVGIDFSLKVGLPQIGYFDEGEFGPVPVIYQLDKFL